MIHSFFKNGKHQLNMARGWKIGKYILAQTKIVTKLNILQFIVHFIIVIIRVFIITKSQNTLLIFYVS